LSNDEIFLAKQTMLREKVTAGGLKKVLPWQERPVRKKLTQR